MKKTEALNKIFTELTPFFQSNNFKLVKSNYSGFTRIKDTGFEWIFFQAKDYYPKQKIEYYVCKRIDVVNNIMVDIYDKFYDIDPNHLKFITTIKFTYEGLNGVDPMGYLPDIVEDADVTTNVLMIEEFFSKQGLKLLNEYDDIKNIDKIINSDNFWETDFKKPFMLNAFEMNRTIIAYLCSNPLLSEIRKYHLDVWNKSLKEYPKCQNLIDAYNHLFKSFENIRPLNFDTSD